MAEVPNTDMGYPLENMESIPHSTCIENINMATCLRCFGVLGQSVP